MRWLVLYLRCRGVPAASVAVVAAVLTTWSLWTGFSDARQVDTFLVMLTIALLVAAAGGTLAGPDEALERTASVPWPPRRAVHLLVTFAVLVLLLALTLVTDARFTSFERVVRDVTGLLGLTALGAAALGAHRAWFLPLSGTVLAVIFVRYDTAFSRLASWPLQPVDVTAAAVIAAVLGLAGAVAYISRGSAPRATDATLT
ncbi:hypothetical protein [Salinispora arenicola]|uniref:hypothetical protein n=1 Tax=Salinispora arenicola TaxID=168697 RepID=UPI000366A9C9|nr:hypothetical protein [Salinispora arenicola]